MKFQIIIWKNLRCKQKIFETVKELTSKIFCLRKKFLVE